MGKLWNHTYHVRSWGIGNVLQSVLVQWEITVMLRAMRLSAPFDIEGDWPAIFIPLKHGVLKADLCPVIER